MGPRVCRYVEEGNEGAVIGVWRGTNFWPNHFSLATDVDVFEVGLYVHVESS
jgi:hypothetical protein